MAKIAVIGGSGLYEIEGVKVLHEVEVPTPFGMPSDAITIADIGGKEVAFLPRHGKGHRLLPTEVNYRANIFALKKIGVECIISISAVGSMKEELKPGDFVLPNQFIDFTKKRESTFFGNGIVGHISMAQPVCPVLWKVVGEVAKNTLDCNMHMGGTYICIEGPQFSSKAESMLFRSWGVDVIGMTNATEAKLAREAEICYVTVAMVTDYDCWHEEEEDVTADAVIKVLMENVSKAKRLIKEVIPAIPEKRECACQSALATAIITARDKIPVETIRRLEPIIGKYLK